MRRSPRSGATAPTPIWVPCSAINRQILWIGRALTAKDFATGFGRTTWLRTGCWTTWWVTTAVCTGTFLLATAADAFVCMAWVVPTLPAADWLVPDDVAPPADAAPELGVLAIVFAAGGSTLGRLGM